MPEITINLAAGRTDEQKKGMMLDITAALVKNLGVPAEAVVIQINEAQHTNKMKGGQTFVRRSGRPSSCWFFTRAAVMSSIMPFFCSSALSSPVFSFVMAGLVPAIHDPCIKQDVDARHKAGHDCRGGREALSHSLPPVAVLLS
eukprot:gene62979-86144_t